MGLLLENFKMAMSSIRSNKMRSFLTMLGIIIGIASVIAIVSVGDSTKATMNKFLSGFGKNRIAVYVNFRGDSYIEENKLFSKNDIDTIREKLSDDFVYVAPAIYDNKKIKVGANEASVQVLGVDSPYTKLMTTNKIIYGRDFQDSDIKGARNFALVDKEFAKKLFKKEDAVGESVSLEVEGEKRIFKIIGVYDKEKTIFESMGMGDQTQFFVPYTLYTTPQYALDLKARDDADSAKVLEKLKNFIARYKKTDKDTYQYNTVEEQADQINNMLGTLSLGLGAIGAISLVVGGIGIMNIMLVSVTERTKEIGIRKSLGARKHDILMQFLIESIILSGTGGIIGTGIGIGLSKIFAAVMKTESAISLNSILVAVIFSFAIGTFFGLYPANKAAKLNPIDALRYE